MITHIKFPYIDKILISNKRRTLYHHKSKYKPFDIHGKVLTKRYNNSNYSFDTPDGNLIDLRTGEKVIANPRTAGEARYWVVNFQDIYNNYIKYQARNTIVTKIKEALELALTDVKPFTKFPLRLELFIYAEKMPVDVDNKGVMYFKNITDLMVKKFKLLPDDSSEYIIDTGRTVWIKVGHRYLEKMIMRITELDSSNLNIPEEGLFENDEETDEEKFLNEN